MMGDKQFTLVMLCVSGGPVCSCWRERERERERDRQTDRQTDRERER